jgi:hypothetical protein
MSYITLENSNSPIVNVKLTDTGRKKLAQGQLNFSAWAIGDSEINYDRVSLIDNNPLTNFADIKVLSPADLQPNIKSFITRDGVTALNSFTSGQINTIKAIVNNKAKERGFFAPSTTHTEFTTLTATTYTKAVGNVLNSNFSGTTSLILGTGNTYTSGDFILFKYNNDVLGTNLVDNQNTIPVPHLWYQIVSTATTTNIGDTIVVDRLLPNLSASSATTQFMIYPSNFTEYYDLDSPIPYWNTNTLDFDGCCDVSINDVPVWNMNNVFSEDLIGMTGTGVQATSMTPYENHDLFGSNSYVGMKNPFLGISEVMTTVSEMVDVCSTPGGSVSDKTVKSISILHYSNNTISNYYGEFLYMDDNSGKIVKVHIPDLMWHRRDFSTGSGTEMGMRFISSGSTKFIGTSQIEYVELYEDPTLIPNEQSPMVVGMVLPQYKVIILTDDELIAAMSYKSNRNWTLPPLSATLKSPVGVSGALSSLETMWLTYTFENNSNSGLTTTLPCQKIIGISNTSSSAKDVEFKISDIDMLPYMRKIEDISYDGYGWYAYNFKILFQITNGERPSPDAWKVFDYTTTAITDNPNETINPTELEVQTPLANGFLIDSATTSVASDFSLMTSLNMNTINNPNSLQFGDERFFYGNIETYIGASIYKTTFNISIAANNFKNTSNPTRTSNESTVKPDIRVSEIGIYDSIGDLVMIGKLSSPIRLQNGRTVMIEVSIDF